MKRKRYPQCRRPLRKSTSLSEYHQLLKTSWRVQAKLFFEHSTLHGVRYIAETNRTFIERFMWFTCVTVGTIATIVVIFSLWEKFQTNPTITGLDTDFHNRDVPFPALILCQDVPTNENKIAAYIEEQYNRTASPEELDFYFELSKLSYTNWNDFTRKYSEQKFISSNTILKDVIINITYSCNEIFGECFWKSNKYVCCHGFFPVFTEKGLCHAFNSRYYKRQIPGSKKELPKFEMKFIRETDIRWSMAFKVKILDSHFRIYILNSNEMVGLDTQPQHIWDFRMEIIMFSVKQTYTTEDTAQLSIKQRHCAFPNEIPLKTNQIYSYTACIRECRMNTAMKLCSCVPYFYPNIKGYTYCDFEKMNCISNNFEAIKSIDGCSCYLGCSNTVYEVEKLDALGSADINDTGKMSCEFVSWPMVRYKREVLFGWVDLLVSFGGIAGLFLGFSLLSGVEIIYYFTVRACCMVIMEKDELRKIQLEEKAKPKPEHDLSLVPYFISKPLPGHGIDEVAKNFKYKHNLYHYTNQNPLEDVGHYLRKPADVIIPPFGIEYVN